MSSLRKLAASYGVLTAYHGVSGLSRARPEALLAVLRVLGAPIERPEDAADALRARREALDRRLLEPVAVLWDDAPRYTLLRQPSSSARFVDVTVTREDGTTVGARHEIESLEPAFRRRGSVRRRLPLPELPPGYHRLRLSQGGLEVESLLLAAPRRAYRRAERGTRWGLFAPLYAAASGESWGAGELSDLLRLAELAARHRAGFIATLPLLATFPFEPSPYSPASRLFWNEIYVDPRRLPEWEGAPSNPEHRARLDELRQSPLIDYRALEALKRPVLAACAMRARTVRPRALEDFLERRRDAIDYAQFRAAAERGSAAAGDLSDPLVLYHLYAQMAAEEQIAEISRKASASGVALYFDLPLGVHPSGYDTAREPSLFACGIAVGAPPDPVFTDGQNWGFPPILPERSRLQHHRYWRACLEQSMRHAGVLRIDHVMGLHRQFWIPEGFEKREGLYVRYPFEELYAVASLESHRTRCEIVGENLGIVPQGVDRSLQAHGWRGLYVLQYSLTGNPGNPVRPVPPGVAASLNTHDTPSFAGFCRFLDLEERVRAGLSSPREAEELKRARASGIAALDAHLGAASGSLKERLRKWIDLLLESDAELVAIALEDLWLEEEPQNVPGRTELPNWRRRMRHAISSLPDEVLETLAGIARRS